MNMGFFSALRVALAALVVNKGRSTLTSLGIVIGISAVIALVSAGDGARFLLDQKLETVGKNLILVRAGARTQQGMPADFAPLTHEDADALRKQLGPMLVGVAPLQMHPGAAIAGNSPPWPTSFVGCTEDLVRVRKWTLDSGEFFNDEDVRRMARVCLIGQTVRKKLFPDHSNPLGRTIEAGPINLRVVGVLSEKGKSPLGADQDDQIFVPLTTLEELVTGNKKLSMILTAPIAENLGDRARADIKRVIREQHRLKEGDEDFDVQSVHEMAQLATVVTKTLHILIAVVASISLIVGGIGIMNIMLVSVTERTREIGIRMAVGATPGDVLSQFLIEAVVLAMVGGIIGITLGMAAALAMARAIGWPLVISPSIVLLTFAISGGVGVFFGYYPALKASRLDPIEALRYE
jgi:putative ABC transport system permease protein